MVLPFPESINRELDKNSPMSIGISKSRLVIGGSLYRDSLDTYYHGPPREQSAGEPIRGGTKYMQGREEIGVLV
jgi:hypothetical protein